MEKRRSAQLDLDDMRAGVLASLIVNTSMSKSKEHLASPDDFFPRLKRLRTGAKANAPRIAQSTEEQIGAFETWTTIIKHHAKTGALRERAPFKLPGQSEITGLGKDEDS